MGTSTTVPQKIAGFVTAEDILTDLFGPGVLRIFDRRSGVWQVEKELEFTLAGTVGLQEMRSKLHGLADAMEDCKVLLLSEVKGVLPALLGEKGVAVSQVSGNALDRLSLVLQEEPDALVVPVPAGPVEPMEVDPGIFRIHLADAMKEHPRLTSRQILLPLLAKGGFTLLEVLCDHPPRWLDTDGRKLGYGYESVPRENPRDGFLVTLYPDACAAESGEPCAEVWTSGGCGQGCSSRYSDSEPQDL